MIARSELASAMLVIWALCLVCEGQGGVDKLSHELFMR